MRRDFKIVDGITLLQGSHVLDLHNDFDFKSLDYSVAQHKLALHWQRSEREVVSSGLASRLSLKFDKVSEFRFMPRDSEKPFTEDECVNSFGYWPDQDWAEGLIVLEPHQEAEPQWLTAIDFMFGAVLAVQAQTVNAKIIA